MQRVQADTRVGRSLISRTAFWTFGRNARFVFRFEWLTLCPNVTVLPQISQRPFTATPLHGCGFKVSSFEKSTRLGTSNLKLETASVRP
jgi:hypothetical protein